MKAYRPDSFWYLMTTKKETTLDLFWIAEGSTSYFQNHLLLQASIMKPDEFFERLAGSIDRHKAKPGSQVMSVAEASV